MKTAVPLAEEFGLVPEEALAELRNCKVSQLRNERSAGAGPAYVRIGRRVLYPLDAVRAYVLRNTVVPSLAPTLVAGSRRVDPQKRKATAA